MDAKRRSGKNYMMMETTLYTYQYFYAAKMKEEGILDYQRNIFEIL